MRVLEAQDAEKQERKDVVIRAVLSHQLPDVYTGGCSGAVPHLGGGTASWADLHAKALMD